MCKAGQACPSDEPTKKKRFRTHPSDYKFVRKVKGKLYQPRIWFKDIGPFNLGCFSAEFSAGQAAKAFVDRYRPGVHLADVLDSLRRDGLVPAHVRLKYVYDLPNGEFGARVKKHGKKIELKPFPTEREAFEAMVEHIASLPPRDGSGSPFVPRRVARAALRVEQDRFCENWKDVFTDPGGKQHVFRDELSVAVEAGGGVSQEAREQVAIFRMAQGRL